MGRFPAPSLYFLLLFVEDAGVEPMHRSTGTILTDLKGTTGVEPETVGSLSLYLVEGTGFPFRDELVNSF
jgi:hypothetical protein